MTMTVLSDAELSAVSAGQTFAFNQVILQRQANRSRIGGGEDSVVVGNNAVFQGNAQGASNTQTNTGNVVVGGGGGD